MKIQVFDGDEYIRVDSEVELSRIIVDGGWKDLADFYNDVGTCWSEIEGKWFTLIMGRLFIK